jgi:hypothetical protein
MSFVNVNRKVLCEAFDFVKWVIPAKPIIVADGNVSLKVSGSTLIVSACDGIMGARAIIPILNTEDIQEDLLVGCDPKRFGKAIAKDSAEVITLEKVGDNLQVSDPQEGPDKFVTLACANMRRSSQINKWAPAQEDCLNDSVIRPDFFSQVLAFLDNFTTEGNGGNGKHDVVVLSESVAHTTNGVNLRGICASKELSFKSDVSLRKRYITPLVKTLANIESSSVIFKDSPQIISVSTEDGTKQIVMPAHRKEPPVVPKEYLVSTGDTSIVNIKEIVKGLDRISTSNYNTATSLTGVDLKISGEGELSKLQLVLEDNKASQTFSLSRKGGGTIEKTMDLNTLLRVLKTFSKSTSPKVFFGTEETRFLKFVDVRTIGDKIGAFIAVCSYARKV